MSSTRCTLAALKGDKGGRCRAETLLIDPVPLQIAYGNGAPFRSPPRHDIVR